MLNYKIKKDPITQEEWLETSLTGKPLLTTPQLNKGTAFSEEERHLFGLTGKLPAQIESLDQQVQRAYLQFQSFSTPLQKNTFLNKLHDYNQVLFYKLMQNHEEEMIPIVYTPTVSTAVEKFSHEFQQVRGLYISYSDRFRIEEILENRSNPVIDLIVVSDGGGVLGIGDQGVGAMLIPVAKLMAYTVCGGINPLKTLPILLDVGTDNPHLLNDPFYLGLRHPRLSGAAYDEFIELFVQAIKKKLPQVFLQWEDFGRDNASRILHHYQQSICSFNDDIQGTGATTLAALLAAVKSTNSALEQQRIVIFGSGSAGTGIADQIVAAMVRGGLSLDEARRRLWLIDREGLLTDQMMNLTPKQRFYARHHQEIIHWKNCGSLLEVVTQIKPTALIGCSAQAGAFTKEIIQTMANHTERPIIFPLSNPTEKSEATPQNLMEWTCNKALIATGSPFAPVHYKNKNFTIAQCNNALIFPGIGLGVIAVKASQVTDNMLWHACMALNRCAPVHQDSDAPILPPLKNAKKVAREIALSVARQAQRDGVATLTNSDVAAYIDDQTWNPEYLPLKKN